MTESLYFEADSHRSLELDTLSAKLGIRVENLLTESLEMLLASYRQSQSGAEPIGLVADLHGGQGRIRTMIEELTLIRFMTGTVNLMLDEIGFTGDIFDSLSRHYEQIFNSSERALNAAGIGPAFRPMPLRDREDFSDEDRTQRR
jgi:hypothetical protein